MPDRERLNGQPGCLFGVDLCPLHNSPNVYLFVFGVSAFPFVDCFVELFVEIFEDKFGHISLSV